MSFTKKQFAPGEKPHYVINNVSGTNKFNQYFYIRTGVIEHVDVDKYQMTVRWTQNNGVRDTIPISFPYAGPAGCIGALPERGSMGIFGFYNEGTGKGSPLLLSHLPAGLDAGLNHNTVKVYPDALSTTDVNEIPHKFRKLSIGDMIFSAPSGATLFMNENAEMHDAVQDSIVIREGDQSIISTSVNNFIFADGCSISSGPVMRNGLIVYDSNGEKILGNGSIMTLPDGKDNVYIVPHGKDITYDTQFYAEYRVDVDELADGKLDLNDINSSSPLSTRDPVVTQAMGNYIGADRREPKQYGFILKARMFNSDKDQKGKFALEKAIQTGGIDEPSILGLAYALHFPKSGAFTGTDKEGHCYQFMPASKVNPLGAGRSMSILGLGNLKEIWGSTAKEANSWDLTTKGGIRWNIGNHNAENGNKSIDIKTTKGISIETYGADNEGYALRLKLNGNILTDFNGSPELSIANLTTNINGLKKENIGGSYTEIVQSDKSVNVSGVSSETVVKEKQNKFGKQITTITTGNDEIKLLKGSIKETITTVGKKRTDITSGNIEQNIKVGSYKTDIKTGNYKLNITGGNIEIKTKVGTVKVSATSIDVKAKTLINIEAPLVKLAKGVIKGAVLTGLPGKPSCFDPITGAPFQGSLKVSAA